MSDERGAEITSAELIVHYGYRRIVFGRHDGESPSAERSFIHSCEAVTNTVHKYSILK